MKAAQSLHFAFSLVRLETAKSIVLIVLCLFSGLSCFGQPPSTNDICEVVAIEGTVEIHQAGQSQWRAAHPGQILHAGDVLQTSERSRATVQFLGLCVVRVNELTIFGIEPPIEKNRKPILDLKSGSLYFYSRERPSEIEFRTPIAAGFIRGTEFCLQADSTNRTFVALFDGEIDVGNELKTIQLHGGEGAAISRGQYPIRAPLINAINIIQWCLYYPALVDPDEIGLTPVETTALESSLEAYRAGDLLKALSTCSFQQANSSDAVAIYRAAVELSVGRVDDANSLLSEVSSSSKSKAALKKMISATQGLIIPETDVPSSTSEWMAESYYLQSQFRLDAALSAARLAITNSPEFGYAWVRAAELEFSLGYLAKAEQTLDCGLRLSPRNAQGWALQGFILAARGRTSDAMAAYDHAIEIDSALGNAWLGRGLCRIRRGDGEGGRKDLQIAATLEPQRSLFRSYLGKAFEHIGREDLAEKELRLARRLDPSDPTAWLYSALLNQQRNMLNVAITELEQSKALNQNQGLFRSRFGLDQDQAVRQANLATIYHDAGMAGVSIREASSAIENDYANCSAHLFLSQSYGALIDPQQYDFRYSAAAYNEWFIGNLLAPAGSEALLRNNSTRDIAPLFVIDGPRFASSTEYTSRGAWQEEASHYGTTGKLDYAVNATYQSDPGQVQNNDLEILRLSAETRTRIDEKDTTFLHAEGLNSSGGDLSQYYNPGDAQLGFRTSETLDPAIYLGWHREWQPNIHTLFLTGYLHSTLSAHWDSFAPPFFYYQTNRIVSINPSLIPFEGLYEDQYSTYTSEIQHLWQTADQTLIVGERLESSFYDVHSDLRTRLDTNLPQDISPSVLRWSTYAYYQWHVFDPLQLTAGGNYSWLKFPENIDTLPISSHEQVEGRFSPKLGLIYKLPNRTTLRAHYTQALDAASTDDEIQLEPTMVGGFNQTYHSLFPKSVVGVIPGSKSETWACGIDHVFPSHTYVSVEGMILRSEANRFFGILTNSKSIRNADTPSVSRQVLTYDQPNLAFSVDQLIGREITLSVMDQLSFTHLTGKLSSVPATAFGAQNSILDNTATLNQLKVSAVYNHSGGAFAQLQSLWSVQSNEGYTPHLEGCNFWQHNVFVGYRIPRHGVELRVGILNLADTDYRLNPLSTYNELPRRRTFTTSLTFAF